jgi:F-type H+-transporting ATPase subunit delta
MSGNSLAQRYARTLYISAGQDGNSEAVIKAVENMHNVFRSSAEVREDLQNVLISAEDKKTAILKAFSELPPLMENFLQLLVQKKRINILTDICQAFEDLVNDEKKIKKGTIYTAVPLNEEDVANIADKLSDGTVKYNFDTIIDKELLGGFLIHIGDRVIDWSLKNKLKSLKERLSA